MFAEDVAISTNVAIFATSRVEITYKGPYNIANDDENAMMLSRRKSIRFSHQFKEQKHKNLPPCDWCFAELLSMKP